MYLLQIENSSDLLIPAIILIIISILISALVLRWIFSIDTQIKNQQATVWLLFKLSEKNGVDKADLEKIMKAFKIK
jgi:high-affinity Fe2+/Pb2+ permease